MRRPIRDGAARRNERTCCISSSSSGPGGTVVPPTGRTMENGLAELTSRDVRENSNVRIVRAAPGSGFIAVIDPAAEQIFSAEFASQPGNAAVDRERLCVNVDALFGHEKQR